MGRLSSKLKKLFVGAVLGLSVLSVAGVSAVSNPVSVEAGIFNKSKPSISLKHSSMKVGVGSTIEVNKFVRSVKGGSSGLKSITVTAPAGVKIVNEKDVSLWKSSTLKFQKKGKYTVKVSVTDKKNVSVSKNVKFTVGDAITKYVNVSTPLKIKKGTNGLKVNYMKGVKYNKRYIKSVRPETFADMGFPTNKKGTFNLSYTVVGKQGESATVVRKVVIY